MEVIFGLAYNYEKEKKKGEIAVTVLKYHKKNSLNICVILT